MNNQANQNKKTLRPCVFKKSTVLEKKEIKCTIVVLFGVYIYTV